MKRKTVSAFAILLAVTLCISLAGCGQSSVAIGTTSPETEEITSEQAERLSGDLDIEQEFALVQPFADGTEAFETEEIPYYYYEKSGSEKIVEKTIEVGYLDGEKGIPYIKVKEYAGMTQLFQADKNYAITYEAFDTYCSLRRENDATTIIDFATGEIDFIDSNMFFAPAGAVNCMDVIEIGEGKDDKNQTLLIATAVNEIRGDSIIISLKDYGIPMVQHDGEFYIPMQTFSDFLLAPKYANLYYNEKAVFFVRYGELMNDEGGQTTLAVKYAETEVKKKSNALKQFTYNELCLALDNYYGLAKEHNIDSFDTYFFKTGLSDLIYSDSSTATYYGIRSLTLTYFSDGHSTPGSISPMGDPDENIGISMEESMNALYGDSFSIGTHRNKYETIREEVRPDGIPGYEEVGNTAYVTFDVFVYDTERDYYASEPENTKDDTISLLLYANKQIFREGSPIENVVLDISCNGGGDANAAACVIAWYLGFGKISLQDQSNGARGVVGYSFDGNLNGQTGDPDDNVKDKNLFCITGPASFSCGNLVPASFKSSREVTLLGSQTGGGGCVVQPLTTADGSGFQVSGRLLVSYTTNGSFYGADEGVSPDFIISNPEHIYDREYMTEYINNLP